MDKFLKNMEREIGDNKHSCTILLGNRLWHEKTIDIKKYLYLFSTISQLYEDLLIRKKLIFYSVGNSKRHSGHT